ncbi:MAG: hypothetical protein LBD95_05525, partial [Clostridiales Family XIII bacterium]|nr:hypothetical protein [Clostridiales Family XIII bacterium]
MVNLDELILRSQELCDRLLLLKKESEKGEDLREDEAERIRLIARSHPIRDHILCAADEHVRRLYMTALCSVIDKEADLARRTEELILAGRVLASFDAEADLSEYISGALKIDADFIGNFSESVEGDTAVAFAVDALLLCKLAGGTNEDMLELATEYISVSDVDAEMFSEICVLVKGILLQDDDAILKMKDMNLNPFVGYMRDAPDGFIVTDFKKLDNAPPRDGLFIANAEISDLEDVIDLDSYGAKSITFYGCRFSNIKGLKSETATVNFEKCGFDRIIIASDEQRCKFIDM